MSTVHTYNLLIFTAAIISSALAQNGCSTHPVPTNGYSDCTNGFNHNSLCATKCQKGYRRTGPSRMLCWCRGERCTWTGLQAKCEETGCEFPDLDTGSLRLVDTWKVGFAGIIEFENVIAPTESSSGWSIVVIFDRPFGQKVSLISWNLELTATSFDGQTFTFSNSKSTKNLAEMIDTMGRFSALIIAENTEGKLPESAFAGLYYHPIKDATCLMAPSMPIIRALYDGKLPSLPSDESKRTTLSGTRSPATDVVSPPQHKNKLSTTAPSSPTTTNVIITTTLPSSPTSNKVAIKDNEVFCKGQRHKDAYVAGKRWEDQGAHYFGGYFNLEYRNELPNWRMVVTFPEAIQKIQTWACKVLESSDDGRIWTFGPNSWNTKLSGGRFEISFIATQAYATVDSPSGQIFLCAKTFTDGDAVIEGSGLGSRRPSISVKPTKPASTKTNQATQERTFKCSAREPIGRPVVRASQIKPEIKPNTDGTKYNYNEVIHKSILFYDAQRSGILPSHNRIPWRGDSALKDGCDIKRDLTGGWYDAGDGVKFNFPMAYSLTTLAWGGIEFRDAYEDAGELLNMIRTVKWATDYFIKTHISKNSLVAQVGHGQTDHNYWGRPEEMKMNRPTYVLNTKLPGSDLAAEVAAALAASSLFLSQSHPSLSKDALSHSKEIFDFADNFRAKYSDSIPDAAFYYKSYSGFDDELVWGATWLYKATNDTKYLDRAEKLYKTMGRKDLVAHEFSWDDKLAGAQALLAEITKKAIYRQPFSQFLNSLPRKKKTPQGLYYIGDWGTNRYAANAALMLIFGARMEPRFPKSVQYQKWATRQIGLLLGDAGRSYVIGFGKDPPLRAHHAGSSCPPYPERCDWTTYRSSKPNHYILYGGLVGGPNMKGIYSDDRSNYQESEVACDYNAGFQSAVAGLKHFAMKKRSTPTILSETKIQLQTRNTMQNVTQVQISTTTKALTSSTAGPKLALTMPLFNANATTMTNKFPSSTVVNTTSPPRTTKNAKKCKPKRSKKCVQARKAARKAAAKKRAAAKRKSSSV